MESVSLFLAGAFSAIIGLNILAFGACGVLMLFSAVYCISGTRTSWGWATLYLVVLGGLISIRFDVAWWMLLGGLVAWVCCGVLYARYYRWDQQLKKLKDRVLDGFAKATEENRRPQEHNGIRYPSQGQQTNQGDEKTMMMVVTVNLRECELRIPSHAEQSFAKDEFTRENVLKRYMPKFEDNRGKVTSWIILWGIYVLKDVTIDLVDNILDWLKQSFQDKANKSFSA